VAEHQQQQAPVAGLVAGASGRGNQLSDFKAGEVVASRFAPAPRSSSWSIFVVRASSSFCREFEHRNSAKTLINRGVKKSTSTE